MKTCARCKETKPPEAFTRSAQSKGGLFSYCRACKRAYENASNAAHPGRNAAHVRRWRAKNPDHVPAYLRRRRYDMTPEQHAAMGAEQGGTCRLCAKGPAEEVDHCHVCESVRGLLCGPCNRRLERLGDTPTALRATLEEGTIPLALINIGADVARVLAYLERCPCWTANDDE